MNEIKIEKQIPAPRSTRGRPAIFRYPFEEMVVGDSFFVEKTTTDLSILRITLSALARKYAKQKGGGAVFTCKIDRINNGVRVWRIK